MSTRLVKGLSIAALAVSLAACSSVPLNKDNSGADNGQGSSASSDVMDPFNPNSPLAQQHSVYFALNSYTVTQQYNNVVEMHAQYLVKHPEQHVRVEGNTDERGSSEYNLALGQKRAEAVRQVMTLAGVNSGQIETISYGKEKPVATGHTEADYSQNRRADIVYLR